MSILDLWHLLLTTTSNRQNSQLFLCGRQLYFLFQRWLITIKILMFMYYIYSLPACLSIWIGMYRLIWYNYYLFASQWVKLCYCTHIFINIVRIFIFFTSSQNVLVQWNVYMHHMGIFHVWMFTCACARSFTFMQYACPLKVKEKCSTTYNSTDWMGFVFLGFCFFLILHNNADFAKTFCVHKICLKLRNKRDEIERRCKIFIQLNCQNNFTIEISFRIVCKKAIALI